MTQSVRTPYLSAAEADTFFSGRPDVSVWSSASDADKTALLREASRRLDLCMKWNGRKASDTQWEEWPRKQAKDSAGKLLEEDTIPACVKEAAAEEALSLFQRWKTAGSLRPMPFASLSANGLSMELRNSEGFLCREALLAARKAGTPYSFVCTSEKTGGYTARSGALLRGV